MNDPKIIDANVWERFSANVLNVVHLWAEGDLVVILRSWKVTLKELKTLTNGFVLLWDIQILKTHASRFTCDTQQILRERAPRPSMSPWGRHLGRNDVPAVVPGSSRHLVSGTWRLINIHDPSPRKLSRWLFRSYKSEVSAWTLNMKHITCMRLRSLEYYLKIKALPSFWNKRGDEEEVEDLSRWPTTMNLHQPSACFIYHTLGIWVLFFVALA